MIKTIKYLSLFIVALFLDTNVVFANEHIIDFNQKGTIEITLKALADNKNIEATQLTLYYIASISSENNKLVYTYNDAIKDCKEDLNDLTNKTLTSGISKCILNKEVPSYTKVTNEDGKVNFKNLELGLYLVKQTNSVLGYSNIDSFLINIPKNIDNKWIYNLKAEPKTDIIRLIDLIVEKKWDIVNSDNIPENVTIDLLKDNEVIDTIILNKENNWTHTWKQIEESDEYSVKEKNVPLGYTDTYRQEGNKFFVTNTKTLVQTGQNFSLILIFATLGLVSIIFGIILNKRKKYE